MNTATPQDTYDHILGSGALMYEWWLDCEVRNVSDDRTDVLDDWTATITAEDGDGGEKTVTFGHQEVMTTARKVIRSAPQYASKELVQNCKHLIFNADEADFDANSADELLQLIVLGEIVYG